MSDNQFVGAHNNVFINPVQQHNIQNYLNYQHPNLNQLNNPPLPLPPAAAAPSFNRAYSPIEQLYGFGTCGEVDHVGTLSEHIGSLYLNEDYTDITLRVADASFQAHKVILACRSEYFRALLYGGMRETGQTEIELQDTHVGAFKVLLRYIYTGRITLTNLKEDLVMEILGLAHKYGFSDLESAVSEYLKAVLNSRNMCAIFGASHLYSLDSLHRFCLDFADKHASDILTTEAFAQLSSSAVEQLISRDSFCAPEIEIFRSIGIWARANPDADQNCVDAILSHIRLPLMQLDELLNTVRPSGLLNPDVILDAIKEQSEKRDMEKRYRGFMMPEVNVATPSQGAQVIEGELKQALLNGDTQNYDMERGFTRHPIEDKTVGIVIELGVPYIVNHIRLLLWDRDMRAYSYFVEVSMDKKDWVKVVDYSAYLCRSWQRLYFKPKVVKYIRVVGTHNTVNRVFHLVALEATYTEKPFNIDDATGLLKPVHNVATIEQSAIVLEGVSRSRSALLNCDTDNYDWDSGYTCHQLGSGAIVVQLPQPYVIGSMRLLLWDCDDRSYSYFIEVSTDQQSWKCVADRTKDLCKAWQTLVFDAVPATFVRIVGTHNTANEVFHCVHFECPAQDGASAERVGSVHTQPSGDAMQSNSSGVVVRTPSSSLIPRPMVNWMMNARPTNGNAVAAAASANAAAQLPNPAEGAQAAVAAAGLAQVVDAPADEDDSELDSLPGPSGLCAVPELVQQPGPAVAHGSAACSLPDSSLCAPVSLPRAEMRRGSVEQQPSPLEAHVPQLPEPEPDYEAAEHEASNDDDD